ncbi:MAG TPA: hypothetical protein VF156_15600 [Agromyces sp.]
MSVTFDLTELAIAALAIVSLAAGVAVLSDRLLSPKDGRERFVAYLATMFLLIGPLWLIHLLAA